MPFSKSSASRSGTEKPSSMNMRPLPPFVARLPSRTLRLPPQYLQVSIKLRSGTTRRDIPLQPSSFIASPPSEASRSREFSPVDHCFRYGAFSLRAGPYDLHGSPVTLLLVHGSSSTRSSCSIRWCTASTSRRLSMEIVEIKGNQVRIGVEAPGRVPVQREEVFNRIKQEQLSE